MNAAETHGHRQGIRDETILALYYLTGLCVARIARHVECAETTVSRVVARAKGRITSRPWTGTTTSRRPFVATGGIIHTSQNEDTQGR